MSKDFDILSYLMGKQDSGGGGGGDITVESKSIDANGTYTAPSGKAYSPVIVDVPNTYAAGDEGKVVSNGALVAQTAHAEVTQNGTIDTTLNNSVTVNVPSGARVLASGTFIGDGNNAFEFNVGSKMALCDFVLNVWVSDGTEFAYNDTYKICVNSGLVSKRFAKFVPVINTLVAPTVQLKYKVNNDGTITNVNNYSTGNGSHSDIRSNTHGGGPYSWLPETIKLKKTTSGFSVRLASYNIVHKYVSGMTYNWEIIYFGTDPTNDIDEVSA